MKKIIMFLIAALIINMMTIININAQDNEIKNIYADVYGLEIDFLYSIAKSDYSDLSLIYNAENVQISKIEVSDTKLAVTTREKLIPDVLYELSVCGEKKKFKIKTVFFENFDNIADTDVTGTVSNQNIYGIYSVDSGESGAFFKNGAVGITDGNLKITDINSNCSITNATISADIKGYAKQYFLGNLLKEPKTSLSRLYIYSRGVGDYGNINAACARFLNNNFIVGITDENGTINYTSTRVYPEYNNTNSFIYGTLNGNVNGKIVSVTKDTVYQTESTKRNVAIRANGTSLSAFADGNSTQFLDNNVPVTEGNIVFTSEKSLMLIDNILVTVFEDYTDKRIIEIDTSSINTDNGISFCAVLNGDVSDGTIYAALYSSDGILNDMDIKPAARSVDISFDKEKNGSYVNVMWWSDNMLPLSDMSYIELQ